MNQSACRQLGYQHPDEATSSLETWNLTPFLPVRRTRFFSLLPVGTGTPLVESLASYTSALAAEHGVNVGNFINGELIPLLHSDSQSRKTSVRPFQATRSFTVGRGINGLGKLAKELVSVLEWGTGCTKLAQLTLIPFSNALSSGHLLSPSRRWCPNCLDEWREASSRIHEPLLWAIDSVRACHVHHERLQEVCPHCELMSKPLRVATRPGRCPRCLGWLGRPMRSQPGSVDTMNFSIRWASMVGDLLAMASLSDITTLAQALQRNLRRGLELVGGRINRFAQLCGSEYYLFDLQCKKRISMDVLTRMCERINMPLTALFDPDGTPCERYWLDALARIKMSDSLGFRSRLPIQTKKLLMDAALEEPAPRLSDIARRLGYKRAVSLWRVDRASCQQISARFRKPQIEKKAQLRQLLQESLASDNPESPFTIAGRTVRFNKASVIQNYSDLCRAIINKRALQKAQRINVKREIFTKALEESPVPTLTDVQKRLGYSWMEPVRANFPDLCNALQSKRALERSTKLYSIESALKDLLRRPLLTWKEVKEDVGVTRQCLQYCLPDMYQEVLRKCRKTRLEPDS